MIESNDHAKLRKLLQLKKLETPGEAYFDAFVDEFHRYQRAEILRQPSLLEQVVEWVQSIRSVARIPQSVSWSAAAMAACLVLVLGAGVFQKSPSEAHSFVAGMEAGYVTAPASEAALLDQPEELGIASASSFDQDFASPRYVTGQTLVAYDTSLAF